MLFVHRVPPCAEQTLEKLPGTDTSNRSTATGDDGPLALAEEAERAKRTSFSLKFNLKSFMFT